jgi:hypothetical protein
MQQRSKNLLVTAAVLAVVLTVYLVATAPVPPDKDQIASAIDSATAAAQRRSANGVMTYVSEDYHDTALSNVEQLHYLLGHALRNAGPISVETSTASITVQGDTAQSVCHVIVRPQNGPPSFDSNIDLTWRKEPARRLLVFPTTTWRIISAEYPGFSMMGGD